MKSYTLMTPGPVPLPQKVLDVLASPMEHHRTPEFIALWNRVLSNLKRVFLTENDVYIHTSTGSGAMESALVNVLSPGDDVIAIVSGKFGERWADMAEVYGARVHRLNVAWGKAVRIQDLEAKLSEVPNARAVLCQACETSTGVLHPIREIGKILADRPTLFVVDAITALGALPMPMDEWHLDVVVAGSQKAFMLPAGLAFISLSKKAWAASETARTPRFYFDLRRERDANRNGESYFSSAVTHVRALDSVLDLFLSQGLESVQARIQALSRATMVAASEIGLSIFPEVPSPSLSAFYVPAGIDGQKLRTEMEVRESIIVMGGQDQLKGKIIRIGNMGAISDENLLQTLRALAQSINRLKPETISELQISRAVEFARAELTKAPAVLL